MKKEQFLSYIKEKGKKHIIFDLDRTLCTLLIDWDPWIKEMNELFSSFGLTPEKGLDFNYAEIENLCIEKYGDKARGKILEINYRNEKEYFSGYDLFPVTMPLIELSQKQADLYLWTSNDKQTITPVIKEMKISNFFKKIITRNDVKYIKPKIDGFVLIYDKKIPKSQYLLIGDSRSDSGAAINAGIDFLNIAEFKDFLA